jgi:RNA polymerase sigma-70 factor (ECF subfamily)
MEDGPAEFEAWYRGEWPRLVALLRFVDGDVEMARDAAAEAFARAYERWGRVSRLGSPSGWVQRVGLNLLRRRWRRAGRERELLARAAADEATGIGDPDPELWSAVRSLPARQREVVALRLVLDLSQEETAAVLGVHTGTVSASLVAARRNLRELLGKRTEVSDVDR